MKELQRQAEEEAKRLEEEKRKAEEALKAEQEKIAAELKALELAKEEEAKKKAEELKKQEEELKKEAEKKAEEARLAAEKAKEEAEKKKKELEEETKRLAEEAKKKAEEEAEKVKKEGGNYQDRPEDHTEAIRDVLHMLVEKYRIQVPIYISENGFPFDDADGKEANLNDRKRIEVIRKVLTWLHKAMEDGIDVRGYYLWSLMDNFEWSAGYAARYGLYYTDYETLERIPKKSAGWYAEVTRTNSVETWED